MKKITLYCLITILSASGLFGHAAGLLAESSSVVISEIGAYESSNHEWLEIYNRGSAAVDLSNWKFYEDNTNHRLTLFRGTDLIIDPGEYAVIAQVAENFAADYPSFTGTILDSSWSSLNESGEEIGLKDAAGQTMELFTYLPCPDTSLQRVDLNLDDYTVANWQTHATGNSAGRGNEFSQDNAGTPEEDNSGGEEENTDTGNQIPDIGNQESVVPVCEGVNLKLNEFVSDPADEEEEFVELFNAGEAEVDLTGWTLADGAGKVTVLNGEVPPAGFYVAVKPKGVLNNDGDLIILKCGETIADQVAYGKWDDGNKSNNAPVASDPYSVVRIVDGQDSDNDGVDWRVTTEVTKGAANVIVAPPAVGGGKKVVVESQEINKSRNQEINNLDAESQNSEANNYQREVIINELLPNPKGPDSENEFIELKNISAREIDLDGFKVADASRKYLIAKKDFDNIVVLPGGLFVITRKISKIALNNSSAEKVYLYRPDGSLADEVDYQDAAKDDVSYSLAADGQWQWSGLGTPGEENIIEQPDLAPQAEMIVTKPRRPEAGDFFTFDATDSADPDGDELAYIWDFGDGNTSVDPVAAYAYQTAGKFKIILTVKDGRGGEDVAKKTVTIYETEVDSSEEVGSQKSQVVSQKTQVASRKSKVKNVPVVNTNLEEVKNLADGERVRVKAVVAAEPGVLGSQIMYLKGSGIQVYFNKKDWPGIKLGDEVELVGELSESSGIRRIKLADKADIKVVSQNHQAELVPEKISGVTDDNLSHLITIAGEVEEVKAGKIYLNTGEDELLVFIKSSTGISLPPLSPGDKVEVTGIIDKSAGAYRLLPRYQSDIKPIGAAPQVLGVKVEREEDSRVVWYLVLVGAVVAVALGWILIRIKVKNNK